MWCKFPCVKSDQLTLIRRPYQIYYAMTNLGDIVWRPTCWTVQLDARKALVAAPEGMAGPPPSILGGSVNKFVLAMAVKLITSGQLNI